MTFHCFLNLKAGTVLNFKRQGKDNIIVEMMDYLDSVMFLALLLQSSVYGTTRMKSSKRDFLD